jgi:hypothetical protein
MNLFLTKEALYRLSYVGFIGATAKRTIRWQAVKIGVPIIGAGDEARTRDIQLGRLKLYQLSYSRVQPKTTVHLTLLCLDCRMSDRSKQASHVVPYRSFCIKRSPTKTYLKVGGGGRI